MKKNVLWVIFSKFFFLSPNTIFLNKIYWESIFITVTSKRNHKNNYTYGKKEVTINYDSDSNKIMNKIIIYW